MSRTRHLSFIPTCVPLEHAAEIAHEDDVAEGVIIGLERQRVRRRVRENLPPLERKLVALRFGLDDEPELSTREIAVRVGMSRQGVDKALERAFTRLRHALDEAA